MRAARLILDVTFVALIAAVLAILAVTRLPAALGLRGPLMIETTSMSPGLPPGSLVYLREQPVTVGSIITFQHGPTPTTHAVIRVQKNFRGDGIEYVTQGWHNPARDEEPVPPEAVIGVVSDTINLPILGYAVWLFSKPIGAAFILTLGILLVLARSLANSPVSRA